MMLTGRLAKTALFLVENNGVRNDILDIGSAADLELLHHYGYVNVIDGEVRVLQKLVEIRDELELVKEAEWLECVDY